MKVHSFQDLKPLRDKLIQEDEKRRQEYLKRNPPVKKIPTYVCPFCKGGGVISSQGADVCCPSCNGVGEFF